MPRQPLALLALAAPTAAFAHTGVGAHGGAFASGLVHPLAGADHLLAMVGVGLFAALIGGRAVWAYPSAFLAAMLVGGALGYSGLALPLVEPTILASGVVLGAAAAFAVRLPLALACGMIALFGVAHGYAHGLEGPQLGGLTYGAGFLLSTAALHGLGLLLGFSAGRVGGPAVARGLGAVAALAGLALAAG